MNAPSIIPPPLPTPPKPSLMLRWILFIAVSVPVVAILSGAAFVIYWFATPVIDEPGMLKTFGVHRADFQRLQQMASEDTQLFRITSTVVEMDSPTAKPLSEERVAEYRKLLRHVGAHHGLSVHSEAIWLTHSSVGLSVSYSETGWVFTTREIGGGLEHVISSFSQMPQEPADAIYFRPIQGGWYLYRESS